MAKAQIKRWWQSRVMWINGLAVLAAVLGLVQQFMMDGDYTEVAYVGLAMALVNLALRWDTTKAIK